MPPSFVESEPWSILSNGVDVKRSRVDRREQIVAQQEVSLVGGGHQHALVSGEPSGLAHIEKALNLLIDPANRLYVSVLIDRAGDGDRLLAGHICQR